MRGAGRMECGSRLFTHRVGNSAVTKDPVGAEKGRHDRGFGSDRAFAVTTHELLMQGSGDNPELRSQIEEIPIVTAKNADRRRPVRWCQWPLFLSEQTDEEGLPRPVRSENGRVFAFGDSQVEAIEYTAAVFDNGRIGQLQYWHVGGHGPNCSHAQGEVRDRLVHLLWLRVRVPCSSAWNR